jgi:hypothetical protein
MSSDLEKSIGYVFSDRRLIDAALTHASLQSRAGNNEKLEFLGDRVLGLVVADMLYRGFPVESEGDLAKRHAALVRQPALAAVAHRIGLPAYIKLAPGEIKAGGLAKDAILADATEALIGAVYLDGRHGQRCAGGTPVVAGNARRRRNAARRRQDKIARMGAGARVAAAGLYIGRDARAATMRRCSILK